MPEGHAGILRLVNSPKLNAPFVAVLGRDRIRGLKESAHLGQTLFVEAARLA
jgi:hypothetical protein